MSNVTKIAVGAGAGYIGVRGLLAIASAPFAAIGCTLVLGFLIILFGAIFDWSEFDRMIHYAGCVIGFVSFLAVAGLFLSGQIVPGVAIAIMVGLGWLIALPISQAIDAHWDTPERQFVERMRFECLTRGDGYYSEEDGYCYLGNERSVPRERTIHGETQSVDAIRNIERLKAAAAPVATPAPVTPSTEEAANPQKMSFFGVFVYQITRPIPWIVILSVGLIKMFWDFDKKNVAAREAEAKRKPDPHAWLAKGRKAAGLD